MEFQKAFVRLRDFLEGKKVFLGGRKFFVKCYRKIYVNKSVRIEDLVEKLVLTYVLSKLDYGVFVDLDKKLPEVVAVRDDKIRMIPLKKVLRSQHLRAMILEIVEEIEKAYLESKS